MDRFVQEKNFLYQNDNNKDQKPDFIRKFSCFSCFFCTYFGLIFFVKDFVFGKFSKIKIKTAKVQSPEVFPSKIFLPTAILPPVSFAAQYYGTVLPPKGQKQFWYLSLWVARKIGIAYNFLCKTYK